MDRPDTPVTTKLNYAWQVKKGKVVVLVWFTTGTIELYSEGYGKNGYFSSDQANDLVQCVRRAKVLSGAVTSSEDGIGDPSPLREEQAS